MVDLPSLANEAIEMLYQSSNRRDAGAHFVPYGRILQLSQQMRLFRLPLAMVDIPLAGPHFLMVHVFAGNMQAAAGWDLIRRRNVRFHAIISNA